MDDRPLPVLGDLLELPIRHWRVIAGGAVVGAVIGALLFVSLPQRYYATSRVALSPQMIYLSLSEEPERQPPVSLDSTAALLGGDEALATIGAAMQVTPEQARKSMVISAKPLSRTLVIQIRGATRQQSVRGANAATEALLKLQSETFAINRKRVRFLKTRVAVLRAEAQQRIAEGSPAQSIFQVVEILQNRLDRAIATNNSDTVVIQRAKVVKYRPGQGEVFVVSGLTIGLVLALLSTRMARRPGPTLVGRKSGRARR
jgi:hypothetical protein